MKKFKSILCGALAFLAGSVALSACGVKTEPQTDPTEQTAVVGTKTTISLAEAERLIVSALAIDNNQLQTQSTRGKVLHAADASEGNRDVFEKLGNFTFDELQYNHRDNDDKLHDVNHFNGQAIYSNSNYKTVFATRDADWESYPIHEFYYNNGQGLDFTGDIDNIRQNNNFDNFCSFTMYKSLFDNETFDSVYDNTATKEINQEGYSITLSGDYKKWLLSIGVNPENYANSNYFTVIVNVDSNNDVISATVDFKGEYNNGQQCIIFFIALKFTKTNDPITEPTWVTEYKILKSTKTHIIKK